MDLYRCDSCSFVGLTAKALHHGFTSGHSSLTFVESEDSDAPRGSAAGGADTKGGEG